MTVPFICVVLAFVLIYVPKIFVSIGMAREGGGYDNHNPREQQARLTGWAKRSLAAHANGFESFAPFAAAVVIAHLAGASAGTSATLAIAHVASRTLYPIIYLGERLGHVRSLVWLVGFGATTGLFMLPWLGK